MANVTERRIEAAAAAILNARAGRRGGPPVLNVLEIVPPHIRGQAIDDARAALDAADAVVAEARGIVSEADAQLAEEAKRIGLGATGQYPHGRIGPGDEGGLKAGLTIANGRVLLNFGKKLEWLAMTAGEADTFAAALRTHADKLRRQQAPVG